METTCNSSTPNIQNDIPHAYEQRIGVSERTAQNSENLIKNAATFSNEQKRCLKWESQLFGVDALSDTDHFIEAHNAFLDEVQTDLQERLPAVKAMVTESVADYFAKGDSPTRNGLLDLLNRRLAATQEVHVEDNLTGTKGRSGAFNDYSRQISVSTTEVVFQALHSRDLDDYHRRLERGVLAHEVLHGLFTASLQSDEFSFPVHRVVRNGLSLTVDTSAERGYRYFESHAKWLNEAVIESFRRQLFETEDVGYEPGVMVLEMLDQLDPGLRDVLLMAALDKEGPAAAFGRVELLVGYKGIEKLDELIADLVETKDITAFKREVVGLLPEDQRAKAASILDAKQKELLR